MKRVILGAAVVSLLFAAIFRVGIDKNLVGTFTEHEWGRYLFGMGAALTKLRWGIGGFVIDTTIEGQLGQGGLNGNPGNLHDASIMQAALDGAANLDVPAPSGYDRLRGSHGDDVGSATFSYLALALFGLKISSLYFAFFGLLSTSLFLFIAAHCRRPHALAALTLLLLALYMICASDLVNLTQSLSPIRSDGLDFKDPRFFGVLAAFPALHLFVSWLRGPPAQSDYLFASVQAALLAFCIHVRWGTLWLAAATLILIVLTSLRGDRLWYVPAGLVTMVLVTGILLPTFTAHPLYRIDGDLLHHPLWPNLLGSLQAHPTWAAKYSATVNGASGDAVHSEVARQEIAKLPAEQRQPFFYSRLPGYPNPEAVARFSRQRFIAILQDDPRIVLETFLVFFPRVLWLSIRNYHSNYLATLTPAIVLIWLCSITASAWLTVSDSRLLAILAALGAAASVISALPTLIAGPDPLLLADHFLWFFFAINCAMSGTIGYSLSALYNYRQEGL